MTTHLNPELLAADPLPIGSTEFLATLRAHGEYMPLAYVLRLSPLIHRTLAAFRPEKNFLDDLSNSGPAVRLYREGRATGPPEDRDRRMEKS